MKVTTKIALVTASMLSMGVLTACQSTATPQNEQNTRMMGYHKYDRHMSPEQRAQFKKMRAERKAFHNQIQKACDGKSVGQMTQIKAGEKTLDGTCNMVFRADRKAMGEMKREFRHDQGHMMRGHSGNHHRSQRQMQTMTEEQRIQIQQQREQNRAERQARWDAMQKACVGQSNGKAIQVKLGEKIINGTCVVRFQPQRPVQPMQPLTPATNLKAS
ncbi:hypothetical protein A7P53_05180 [Acinetobacter defluvii]|uniref:hypothetical protein n=1 Tax=Acinetobacter defluvii TaxID=1871111 RepID=UPI00148F5D57|nr:hypothetical protein [Acinetobacter defluvii]NNP71863.1 hypothetical protein [Acinetobacter defluvii]